MIQQNWKNILVLKVELGGLKILKIKKSFFFNFLKLNNSNKRHILEYFSEDFFCIFAVDFSHFCVDLNDNKYEKMFFSIFCFYFFKLGLRLNLESLNPEDLGSNFTFK
jgi:hypothetical protein